MINWKLLKEVKEHLRGLHNQKIEILSQDEIEDLRFNMHIINKQSKRILEKTNKILEQDNIFPIKP